MGQHEAYCFVIPLSGKNKSYILLWASILISGVLPRLADSEERETMNSDSLGQTKLQKH